MSAHLGLIPLACPDHLASNREPRATYSHRPKLASRNVQISNPLTNVFASSGSCIGTDYYPETRDSNASLMV